MSYNTGMGFFLTALLLVAVIAGAGYLFNQQQQYRAQLDQLLAENSQLKQDNDRLSNEVKVSADQQTSITGQLEETMEENSILKSEVSSLTTQVNGLTDELNRIKTTKDETAALANDLNYNLDICQEQYNALYYGYQAEKTAKEEALKLVEEMKLVQQPFEMVMNSLLSGSNETMIIASMAVVLMGGLGGSVYALKKLRYVTFKHRQP